MMRLLYNLLFPFAFLVFLPCFLTKMFRRGSYRRDFGQRLARYDKELRHRFSRGKWIWVHAGSVGELLSALKILDELHRRHPEWNFVVSSTTSTAHAIATSKQQDWWVPVYTPLDFPCLVRSALAAVKPRLIILTESEMWPNFVWTASDRAIPLVLVNARVSPRSARRYRKFASVLRSLTRHLAWVGLQEPEHGQLWAHLDVPLARLQLTGSVKYDPGTTPPKTRNFRAVLEQWGISAADPILLGASTHEGEEEILASTLIKLRQNFPTIRLLIAPRHVERTADIVKILQGRGLSVGLRDAPPSAPPPDILIINTTGELRDWHTCASVVFVGKSLTGRGGQNPVEAILTRRPVLFGPHMENFAALRDHLLATGGAIEVQGATSLAATTARLLLSPEDVLRLDSCAMAALDRHRGATKRTADLVEAALKEGDEAARAV